MPYFIKKIEYNKWIERKVFDGEPPSADAITGCLKTKDNKLSIWLINNLEEITDAIIAIITNFDFIDAIDILTIDESLIREQELVLTQSPGITRYESFKNRHYDICDLDYCSLGKVSNIIIKSIKNEKSQRLTKSELKEILVNAIKNKKVELTKLKEHIQKGLAEALIN